MPNDTLGAPVAKRIGGASIVEVPIRTVLDRLVLECVERADRTSDPWKSLQLYARMLDEAASQLRKEAERPVRPDVPVAE